VGSLVVLYLMSTGVRLLTLAKLAQVIDQLDAAEDIAARGGANRFVYYAAAVAFWLEAPIFGNGVGSFSIMLRGEERLGAIPHNMILEILCSLGLVGLGLFLVMLWIAGGLVAGGRLRRDPLLLGVAMLVMAQFVSAMLRGDLGAQERLFLWLGLMAMRPLSSMGSGSNQRRGMRSHLHRTIGADRSARQYGSHVAANQTGPNSQRYRAR
jgi:O-antigen ligase